MRIKNLINIKKYIINVIRICYFIHFYGPSCCRIVKRRKGIKEQLNTKKKNYLASIMNEIDILVLLTRYYNLLPRVTASTATVCGEVNTHALSLYAFHHTEYITWHHLRHFVNTSNSLVYSMIY